MSQLLQKPFYGSGTMSNYWMKTLLASLIFSLMSLTALAQVSPVLQGDATWMSLNIKSPTGKVIADVALEVRQFVVHPTKRLVLMSPTRTTADNAYPHILKINMLLKTKNGNHTVMKSYGVVLSRDSRDSSFWSRNSTQPIQNIQFNWGDLIDWSEIKANLDSNNINGLLKGPYAKTNPFDFLGIQNTEKEIFDRRSALTWREGYSRLDSSDESLLNVNLKDNQLFLNANQEDSELNKSDLTPLNANVKSIAYNSANPFPYRAVPEPTWGFKKPGASSIKNSDPKGRRFRIAIKSIGKALIPIEVIELLKVYSRAHVAGICSSLFK